MTAVVALERVDRAGEIGEALQVFAVLEVVAAHGRREAQHLGFLVGAQQRDCVVEPFDHVLDIARQLHALQHLFLGNIHNVETVKIAYRYVHGAAVF